MNHIAPSTETLASSTAPAVAGTDHVMSAFNELVAALGDEAEIEGDTPKSDRAFAFTGAVRTLRKRWKAGEMPGGVTEARTALEVVAERDRLHAAILSELQGMLLSHHRRSPMPHVRCADGFTVSVQAGRFHYSTPRADAGPWTAVELGYPSAPMPALAQWCEGVDANATDTVWGYVPIHHVATLIAEHGGLAPR